MRSSGRLFSYSSQHPAESNSNQNQWVNDILDSYCDIYLYPNIQRLIDATKDHNDITRDLLNRLSKLDISQLDTLLMSHYGKDANIEIKAIYHVLHRTIHGLLTHDDFLIQSMQKTLATNELDLINNLVSGYLSKKYIAHIQGILTPENESVHDLTINHGKRPMHF